MNNEEFKQQTEAYLSRAKTHHLKGETAQTVAAYEAADRLFAEQGDERGRSRCWSGIAKAYGKNKEFEKSISAFEEAANHAALAPWPDKEIEALYNMGLTLQQLGIKKANLRQTNQAIEAFQKGLKVAKEINDQASAGVLLISLGFACAWLKREDEAITYFKEAAPFALDNVDFDTAFSVLSTLGSILSNLNRGREAIPYFERALELAKSAQGDIVAVADTFANLGISYEKAGRLSDAVEALETYREILSHAGDVKAADAAAMVKRVKQKIKLQNPRDHKI